MRGECLIFRKDNWFVFGWIAFVLMFVLEKILPKSWGVENGIIENFQLLFLVFGAYICWRISKQELVEWGGSKLALSYAGVIFFFLNFMREISWGRVFYPLVDGRIIRYSEMGLYGKLVHPMVAVLIVSVLFACYKAKIWKVIVMVKVPVKSFALLLMFILLAWIAEHRNIAFFYGDLAEELAETGAYMMIAYITKDMISLLKKSK